MGDRYLIWSSYHDAWWGPERRGYTTQIAAAGRYDREEAIKISAQARDGWKHKIEELPIREADALACFDLAMPIPGQRTVDSANG